MSRLSPLCHKLIYDAQQLLSQPGNRRITVFTTSRHGFTIVELLIVIVVIGILAAIVIVAYNGIQNRANDTTVKSDLSNAGKIFEIYKVDMGAYPASSSQIVNIDSTKYSIKSSQGSYNTTSNNFAFCYISGGASYALVARSKSNKIFYISDSSNGVQESSTWYTSTTTLCPSVGIGTSPSGTGSWGYAPSIGGWQAWTGA